MIYDLRLIHKCTAFVTKRNESYVKGLVRCNSPTNLIFLNLIEAVSQTRQYDSASLLQTNSNVGTTPHLSADMGIYIAHEPQKEAGSWTWWKLLYEVFHMSLLQFAPTTCVVP